MDNKEKKMRLCYHCMQQIQDEKIRICPNCGKSLAIQQVPPRFLRPGTVLQGKFVIGYPLGSGGFGNTYVGWNKLLLRKVAVKEFYPEQYIGRGADGVTVTVPDGKLQPRFRKGLQQFLEEARSVAALQDIRGVVAISNFFEENGTGYIVMEYLEGMDVKTILKKSGDKKDYEWCRRVVLTVLHTLRDIHKRGVLHRDIAPDNIFVTDEGVIKLIDFGAAKHASSLANMKSEVVLKVGYAPIEQYSRDAKQGPYTDLYAVAALFYRMLTGQKPIPANERIQQDALIPPSEMNIRIPEQAELGMMVCLNVRPEYRLQSADEFMEALDGRNFVPVYEPEWILPPAEENNGFLGKIAKLPAAAKAAICFGVLFLVCGTVFGVSVIGRNSTQKAESVSNTIEDGRIRLKDYTGKSYEDVAESLKAQGFENIAAPQYDFSSEAEDVIIEQSLPASEVVDVDSELVFKVSGGDTYYTMPDFTGMTEAQVIQFFTDRNFDVEVHGDPYNIDVHMEPGAGENAGLTKKTGKITVNWYFSGGTGAGICYDQSVAAGEKYDSTKEASVFISMGQEEAAFIKQVPDFTGLTKEKAEKVLKKAGLSEVINLKFKDSKAYKDGISKGQVNRQSIAAGEEINLLKNKGQKLVLYIQKEKPAPREPEDNGIEGSDGNGPVQEPVQEPVQQNEPEPEPPAVQDEPSHDSDSTGHGRNVF